MENKEVNNKDQELEQILKEINESVTDNNKVTPATEKTSSPDEQGKGKTASEKSEKPQKAGSGLFADLAALLLRIGWISFIFAILLLVVCGVMVNNGNRMAPAFHDRDVVIFYRLAKDIQAGDVVVFRGENNQMLVGRVVAKAGDTVDITSKGLQINGYYQAESYVRSETVLFEGGVSLPVTLRPGEYFILYDDRSQGGDSRYFGPIPSDRICGRVMLSIRQRDF